MPETSSHAAAAPGPCPPRGTVEVELVQSLGLLEAPHSPDADERHDAAAAEVIADRVDCSTLLVRGRPTVGSELNPSGQ